MHGGSDRSAGKCRVERAMTCLRAVVPWHLIFMYLHEAGGEEGHARGFLMRGEEGHARGSG